MGVCVVAGSCVFEVCASVVLDACAVFDVNEVENAADVPLWVLEGCSDDRTLSEEEERGGVTVRRTMPGRGVGAGGTVVGSILARNLFLTLAKSIEAVLTKLGSESELFPEDEDDPPDDDTEVVLVLLP